MSENNIPQLTLEPQAAAAQAVPELTLDPSAPAAPAEPAKPEAAPVQMDDSLLNDAEKKAVEDFSKKIDIMDSNMILQYGAAAQKNVASFSENALTSVRTKDLGEVGKSLSALVVELKGFGEEEEKKGLFGRFKKAGSKLETMKAQYAKVESNVDKIARELEQHQVTLLILPGYLWQDVSGFNAEELSRYEEVIRSVAHLILRFSHFGAAAYYC